MRAWWWVAILGALLGCAGMDGSGVAGDKAPVMPGPPPADGGSGDGGSGDGGSGDGGADGGTDAGTEDGGEQSACAPLPISPGDPTLQSVSAGGQIVLFFQDFAALYALPGQPQAIAARGGHYFFSEDGARAYSGRAFWGYGGGDGEVYELDAATGAQTVIFDASFSEVTADETAQLIAARNSGGTLVLYDTRTRQRHVVSQGASSLGFPVGDHWAFDARGQLQLWRRAATGVISLGAWTRAEAVHGALLYVNPQGQLFGWSEQGGPQALGRAEAQPILTGHRSVAEAGVALIDAEGVAWAWRFTAGQVRRLTSGAHAVALSSDAEHVAVASGAGLELFSVEAGTRRSLLPEASEVILTFDPEGSRLAAGVREGTTWRIVLVDVATGEVTRTSDEPPQLAEERIALQFSPDGSLLLVTPAGEAQSVYDAATGALRYRSPLAVASSGTYSHWFDGDTLLLRNGAHMGPPDRALYSWTQQAGEARLGEGTRLNCFHGPAVFFELGLAQASDAYGGIAAFRPGASVEVFSERARAARCTQQGDAVLFLDAPLDPSADGRPGPGTLRLASPGAALQTFASDVRQFVVGRAHLAFLTADRACVAPIAR